jgi:hypothetical protein
MSASLRKRPNCCAAKKMTRCAITGREQMQQTNVRQCDYSITSSAVASSVGGTVRPSALAVLRLITNWNFAGA